MCSVYSKSTSTYFHLVCIARDIFISLNLSVALEVSQRCIQIIEKNGQQVTPRDKNTIFVFLSSCMLNGNDKVAKSSTVVLKIEEMCF